MAETTEETRLKAEQASLAALTTLTEAERARLMVLNDMIQAQVTLRQGLETEKQLTLETMRAVQARKDALIASGATQEEINEVEQEHQEAIIANLRAQLEEEVALNGVMSSQAILLRQGIRNQQEYAKQQRIALANEQKRKDLLDGMTGGLVSQVTSYFTIAGLTKNISESFASIMQGNVDYAKTTGQVADRTMSFGNGVSQFGIGFEKMNKSAGTLFTTMSGFSELNQEIQENLAASAAALENVGISSETSGKNMDTLMKTFKMSSEEAIKTNEELARIAIGAGIAPSKMAAGFAENMPRLAAYGKQAIQVFADLQKQAKSLGVEVSTLTSIIGDTMDTFEGSAKAAGKFNAVLGGNYLNSIEMLNATESERVVILKKAFEQSGKNFDSLSKYEKKAIAATLGIQNLDDATKLFSKSSVELAMDQSKQAASQEELAKVQREAADTTEQVKNGFNFLLAAMRPVVYVVKTIVNGFGIFMDSAFGMVTKVLLLVYALTKLSAVIKLLNGLSNTSKIALLLTGIAFAIGFIHDKLLVPNSPILYYALMALPFIIYAIGKAAESSEKSLYALGAAFMMVGAGVFLASQGLANLVQSFNGLGEAAPYAAVAVGVFTLAFFGLMALLIGLVSGPQALLTGAAIGVLLSVGATAMMIGAGMAIAALGVSELVKSFASFFEVLTEQTVGRINALSGAILGLVASLSMFAIGGLFGVAGLGGLAYGILGVSAALLALPDDKVLTLTSFNEVLNNVKTIKDADIKPTEKLMLAVKDYYEAQEGSKDADKDAFVAALKEVMGQMNPFGGETGEGGSKSIPIKLVIGNGRELAAELRPLMREKYKETLGLRG